MIREPCPHTDAVTVESAGEIVAGLCPTCDVQLPAAWFTCTHDRTFEVTMLSQRHAELVCSDCGASFAGLKPTRRIDPAGIPYLAVVVDLKYTIELEATDFVRDRTDLIVEREGDGGPKFQVISSSEGSLSVPQGWLPVASISMRRGTSRIHAGMITNLSARRA